MASGDGGTQKGLLLCKQQYKSIASKAVQKQYTMLYRTCGVAPVSWPLQHAPQPGGAGEREWT